MNVDVPAGDVARLRQQLATAVVRNDDYIAVPPEEVRIWAAPADARFRAAPLMPFTP